MEIKGSRIKPFGPSIFKVSIPPPLIKLINDYVDDVILNKKKSLELDYGNSLVGDVTQEFKLDNAFIKSSGWNKFLEVCAAKWIELETEKKITQFKILESWIVRQFENEYNPIHWHGGHISGAGFLKVPETLGDWKQKKENHNYAGGNLELVHGSLQFTSKSKFEIVPKVGDFYFFPNYLMHTVYPFKNSNEERRSISFNAKIDNSIYNVYEG